MEAGIGTEFDEHLARAFVRMMRTWEGRVAEMERPDQPVIQPVEDIGGTEATETPGGSSQDPAINGPDGTDDPGTVGSGG